MVLSIICIIWTSCILISDMLYQRIHPEKKGTFLGLLALLSTVFLFILGDILAF